MYFPFGFSFLLYFMSQKSCTFQMVSRLIKKDKTSWTYNTHDIACMITYRLGI